MRKHNRCRGIRLWKWGRFQIEVWFIPKGELIEPHVHEKIDSTIMLVYGLMTGVIGPHKGTPKPLHRYPVPAGTVHSAAAHTFTIFMNFERWKSDDVTSAATDFTAV